MLCSRGGIWDEDILIAEIEELEKLDASETYPRRLNAKEVRITQKDGEFVSLVADGSAKLSGRDYELQEPTLRRESTVKKESLNGESHGDREEFQPEETKDDEGINKDFCVHAEARKEIHLSSTCRTEKFNWRAERRIISYLQDSFYWTKLIRIRIYNAVWELEKPKHLSQKQIQLFMILQGKDGIL